VHPGHTTLDEIFPFLNEDDKFDPEALRAMSIAFKQACRQLVLKQDAVTERAAVARKIVELARQGERDMMRLCEGAAGPVWW
jgi:hypothetical protein